MKGLPFIQKPGRPSHSPLSFFPYISAVLALGMCASGCAVKTNVQGRSGISRSIEERTGHGLAEEVRPGVVSMPEGISLEDGLSEDEAVAIALWNNAAFQTDLAALGFSRADLMQAGLLRNPILSIYFPLGPKQFEATATWPIEAFWQRPRRIAAARLDAEKIAEGLVQNGLNLVRDVKVAHAELLLSHDRAGLAEEILQLRNEFAEITEARLRAGDISELEANVARSQARMAEMDARRASREIDAASDRLRFLLGMSTDPTAFSAVSSPTDAGEPDDLTPLLKDAFASRPDLRAAELAMEAAGERAGLEKASIFTISAILDMNGEGKEGFEAGPGTLVGIPLFDTNQAGRARAMAEVEQTARRYVAVQQLIASEVQEARTRYVQAAEALTLWRERILAPLEESARQAESAYSAGDVSYLAVVDATIKLVEGRLGEASAAGDLRRARAELNRSIGRNRVGNP